MCQTLKPNKNPGPRGWTTRGGGTTEGGRGETGISSGPLVCSLVNVRRHLANLAQFFIGKKCFLLALRAFFVSQSGLFGNSRKFLLGNSQKQRRALLRDVTKFDVFH